jgi:hypothetical protein
MSTYQHECPSISMSFCLLSMPDCLHNMFIYLHVNLSASISSIMYSNSVCFRNSSEPCTSACMPCCLQTCLLALCMHDFLTAFTSTCRNRYLSHCMPNCMHFPLTKYISFIDLCFMCICLFVCMSFLPGYLSAST